ncbi:tRNA (adenosine(37)-N6)-threonylcarbamoyltransferase complex dimerization subunit type 1 TsaB [Spiroplasma alleghenense]|uniref:Glycoprotease n=1 Tax=Spiroplasma alleghenense TaxID=216931 RepID=A0A345Z2K9_9MOLU|nr:tRNA (adenosine(37)-N6)-threonylcarbamoyltransferase complex dimerization subunit type 1 TsaB [Spiroplasma alleghenense]AXK50838.1 glycoprotease [Spiroplasma alleghenense]
MELFIDTCNNNLVFLLIQNNKIIDEIILKDNKRISDIFQSNLDDLLKRNSVKLKEIKSIYITKGPGSYTGVRIGLTMGKTLFCINPVVKIFTISSLLFQAGLKNVISILDARSQKSYFGVYENGVSIIEDQILPNETVEDISKSFEGFLIVQDQIDLDYASNFLELKTKFKLVTKAEELNPNYIKNFI